MVPTPKAISERLAPLIGQPLWRETRSLSVHVLHFGERIPRPLKKGGSVDVGSQTLHLQCAWRILREGELIVGSRDRLRPREDSMEDADEDFSSDAPRSTRCDEKMEALLGMHTAQPLTVRSIVPAGAGALRLELSEGYTLEIFPDDSEGEQWRYFNRQTDDHFVCSLEEVTER